MKKSLLSILALSLCSFGVVPQTDVGSARQYRSDEEADGSGTTEGEGEAEAEVTKGRKIAMDDGRELIFTEKQKIQKEHGIDGSNVFARIDFDNGKSVQVLAFAGNLVEIASFVAPAEGDIELTDELKAEVAEHEAQAKAAQVTLKAIGHGLVQKLGDAAAGADTTDDALEAILEVANRFNKGDWSKAREGGSAKGAGDLVLAMHEFLQQSDPDITKDKVRDMLAGLSPADKNGLRQLDEIKAIIAKLKAARAPSKRETEAKAKAAEALAALKQAVKPAETSAA